MPATPTLRRLLSVLLLLVAALVPCLAAHAQPPPPPPPGRVLLFAEPNYRGETLVVDAGSVIENLEFVRDSRGRRWNDRVASVRIEGPVLLIAYEHSSFRGAQTTITRNSADLATLSLGDRSRSNWAKLMSSLRVEPVQPNAPVFIEWNRRDAERAVRSAFRDILGRDPDDSGLRTYLRRLMDAGWTEDQLRDNLRHSPEFRERDLDALVRKIYREVLGRDPDPAGVTTYVRRLQGGMSEAEFRADLHRSGESAAKTARESVTRAYREILRRDPDAGGLANYTKMILERGWDDNRVREALRKSDEFRHLPRR
jgi:hypothetical protein